MDKLVSIIVPVYKVEKYIYRCVDSLVNQSLQSIEIVLVDDGSPDNCPSICDDLAKKDSRIKVVHKENGGLSSARNAGLDVAKGKYVGFVDSDDDVELNMYEKMVAVAEQYKVDFVMADYRRVLRDGSSYIKTLDIEKGYYNRDKIISDIFPNLIMRESIKYGPLLSVWHCIYRREFLEKNSLRFDDKVKWSEDNIFSAIMGYRCTSFYYMKGEALYHYYQNEGTITTSYRKGAWNVYCTMNNHLHEFFDKITDYDFGYQLKLHLVFYACNCTNQETKLPRQQAIKGISGILATPELVEAFKGIKLSNYPFKLRLQLAFMKYKRSRLLYYLRRGK